MTETGLTLARFMRGDFDPAAFTHREHVHMGFEMLRQHDFAETAFQFSRALRAMAARVGKPDVFHQTTTIAFLSLIAERMASQHYTEFEDFLRAHPDLLDKSALSRWYPSERLSSDIARRTFLLPTPAH